jgi:hypothetical protein
MMFLLSNSNTIVTVVSFSRNQIPLAAIKNNKPGSDRTPPAQRPGGGFAELGS